MWGLGHQHTHLVQKEHSISLFEVAVCFTLIVLVFKYRAPTAADCNQRDRYLGWWPYISMGTLCLWLCCLLARTLTSGSRPALSSYCILCFLWALGHNICLLACVLHPGPCLQCLLMLFCVPPVATLSLIV